MKPLHHAAQAARVAGMLACVLCALATLPAPAAEPLAALAEAAQNEASAVRLARSDAELAQRRLELARTGHGVRVFGGASLAGAREAVSEQASRDYRRLQAQLGLRWSWGAASARRQRDLATAELDGALAQLRLVQARREAVLALRQAYVHHLYSVQRIALAEAFLSSRAEAGQQLEARRATQTLLDAERLSLLGLFDGVQAQSAVQHATRAAALRQIERLTGQPTSAPEIRAPDWPTACLARQVLLAYSDEHPGVAQAHYEATLAKRQRALADAEGIEAGASISQSGSRDFGGPPGRNTIVSVDFSMPLDWRAQRDAARAQALASLARAEDLVQLRREEFLASVQQASAQWKLRQDELALNASREYAAQEAVRVAQLRLPAFDGDGIGRLLAARYALLQARLARIDGAERLDLAVAELLALSGPCGAEAQTAPFGPLIVQARQNMKEPIP